MAPNACPKSAIAVLVAGMVLAQTPGQSVYQQAAGALQRGNPGGAVDLLEPWLRSQPKDLRALTLMGMALTAQGRAEDANRIYREALQIGPEFAPALRGLAMNEMAAGETPAARKHFEALLKLTPAEPVAHLALGEIQCGERRYAECLDHFEHSGGTWSIDSRTILKFADAAIQLKQPARAEAALAKMPATADPEQHLQAGLMLARLEKYEPAAIEFERAASDPNAYLAGYNLALARLKANQPDAAVKTASALIGKGSRTAELYNVLAQAYEKKGQTREAFDALRTATQIDPGDETNYLDLIALCLDHKNLDVALDIANVGVRRLPKTEKLSLQKAIVLAMRGEFEEARQAFAAASELNPDKGLPKVALGLVLLQMDRADEAARVLRNSAVGKEDRYLVNWFLAEAISRGALDAGGAEEKEAVAALRSSIGQRPDLAQPRALLGKLLLRSGDLDGAIDQLERSLEIEPGNTGATYQLAQAYRKKGNTKRANELFATVSKAKSQERDDLMRKGLELIKEGGK
jgi:tetratricopeptide (TPR) repeat protein